MSTIKFDEEHLDRFLTDFDAISVKYDISEESVLYFDVCDYEQVSEPNVYATNDKASFIDGENIVIDGGMSKLMIYHDDDGWSLNS